MSVRAFGGDDVARAVRHAQVSIDQGELTRALTTLRGALAGADLDPRWPDADLADASRLYAGVLAALGETYSAAPYSAYAHAAAHALFAPTDARTLYADATHAFVLRVTGEPAMAADLHRDLVARMASHFGTAARPVLAAQADLAVALHAAGKCLDARQTLHRTYFIFRDTYGASDPDGIRMLTRLGAMTRDCGGFEKAHQYFDRAKALCARHLTVGDPLTRQVTALARAGIDESHACGEPVEGAEPTEPPAEPPTVPPEGNARSRSHMRVSPRSDRVSDLPVFSDDPLMSWAPAVRRDVAGPVRSSPRGAPPAVVPVHAVAPPDAPTAGSTPAPVPPPATFGRMGRRSRR
jgi:hypothetical protein